jgi:uncharacterized protein VirK/YbjX
MAHARRNYPTKSFLASVMRSMRVLMYYRQHQKLLQVGVVLNHVRHAARNNLFYHLNHRHYLANFLSFDERVDLTLFHMQAEDRQFNAAYKDAVYLDGGLRLWEQTVDGTRFHIQLRMASRIAQEGDLEVALFVDEQRLHSFKFTWLDGARINQPGQLIPWVTCCQGLRRSKTEAPEKFAAAFPNSWPKLFCLAALRGLAVAMGSEVLIGIPGHAHIAAHGERADQFASTYDEFWQSMHGVQTSRYGYVMPSRLPEKDLSTVASKHRKRAENRRRQWLEIEQSAQQSINAHRNLS